MTTTGNKPDPTPPDPAPEGVGIGRPAEEAAKPTHAPPSPPRKTPATRGERKSNPRKSLREAALAAARKLKREHRTCYDADPKAFRALVKKAHARVFRLRPGPKPNARIAQAARERGRGVRMEDLYLRYIDHYDRMTDYTR